MIAPRMTPWAAALCVPLMFAEARGRHARRAVKLRDGFVHVFEVLLHCAVVRVLFEVIYALCTLRMLDIVYIIALAFGVLFMVAVIGVLLGEFPRFGLFAYRVRVRFYHPLLERLVRIRFDVP